MVICVDVFSFSFWGYFQVPAVSFRGCIPKIWQTFHPTCLVTLRRFSCQLSRESFLKPKYHKFFILSLRWCLQVSLVFHLGVFRPHSGSPTAIFYGFGFRTTVISSKGLSSSIFLMVINFQKLRCELWGTEKSSQPCSFYHGNVRYPPQSYPPNKYGLIKRLLTIGFP